ncbi:TIGD4 [Cordylochernes scorpioides]|uniref:TIGD4 n=1 Tax=Cordylochernes scorpioides TaxID=51811 RepID=A0ABY6KZK5_9ARAC|nr:TIGD4 [Cordylochernes scorpioides]
MDVLFWIDVCHIDGCKDGRVYMVRKVLLYEVGGRSSTSKGLPCSMKYGVVSPEPLRFEAGRISVEDDPRQGRPKFQRTDENVQKITDLIKENPRTTLLELEQDTGISKTTIGRIVTEDLKLKKTPAKFIPRFLTNEQKLCRLATCEDMMEMTRTDPEWKDKIITGDETWVYGYDPETKPQSAEWRGERKQTRNSLSLSVKLQILREIEVEKKKKTDVAQKHNIPQSSLSTIIKNSEKIHQQALHAGESSRKRARGSTYADVDEALLQWFKQARSAALPVNGPLLSEKAKTLALEFGLKDFTGSGGWIERWKARHGIKLRNICGESADVNRETMTNWLTDVMPNIISNYACKDIFNADETGLFWRLLPDKTLHFKGETCTGGKASKERITILLCCNMDGSEKMQPLVIGKAKQPRCFRGIKHLPVQYEANQKAWMTGLLFESWVRHIDKKMAGQHRQIILLLDNCGAHPPDMQGLTNTRIAFLPPNTTSMLQPCDQGIIRNFKMIHRTRLMRKYLTAYDVGTALTINLKQAVDIISVAWNDVLPATISNCWHHSGIIKSDVSSPLDTPQPATQMWEQQSLFDRMKEVLKIPLEMDFDSYADADNDVVTNAMLSDVEIVESILQAKEEEETDQVDEEVDPIVHIPHPKEVLESIQTLRLFLQCQDESKSLHRHLSDLDNIEKSVQHLLLTSKCQKKITNYFSKNT